MNVDRGVVVAVKEKLKAILLDSQPTPSYARPKQIKLFGSQSIRTVRVKLLRSPAIRLFALREKRFAPNVGPGPQHSLPGSGG